MKRLFAALPCVALLLAGAAAEGEGNVRDYCTRYADSHTVDDNGNIVLKFDDETWAEGLVEYWLKVRNGETLSQIDRAHIVRLTSEALSTATEATRSENREIKTAGERFQQAFIALNMCMIDSTTSIDADASDCMLAAIDCVGIFGQSCIA